jgi:hypothetical protein
MTPANIQFFGKVLDGAVRFNNRKEFNELIKCYDGKDIVITIKLKKAQRSLSQNAYYWSCIIPIIRLALKDVGYIFTKDETHEILRCKFLKETIADEKTGEILFETLGSTTKLNKVTFGDYIFEIKQWAKEYLNCDIPEPSSQSKINF